MSLLPGVSSVEGIAAGCEGAPALGDSTEADRAEGGGFWRFWRVGVRFTLRLSLRDAVSSFFPNIGGSLR